MSRSNWVPASRSRKVRDEPGRIAIATSHAPTRQASQQTAPRPMAATTGRWDGRWASPPHAPARTAAPMAQPPAAATAMVPVVRSRMPRSNA